jgi:hypothetical protein
MTFGSRRNKSMKLAIAQAPALRLPVVSQTARDRLYKLLGVLIVVGIPVLFWTAVLALAGNAFGFTVGSTALMSCALAVGVCCLFGASVVVAKRDR